jgi:hypothetical protein
MHSPCSSLSPIPNSDSILLSTEQDQSLASVQVQAPILAQAPQAQALAQALPQTKAHMR